MLPQSGTPVPSTPVSESLTRRAVARAVAGRQATYAEELQRIVDAAYRVIERTGTVDPTLRDILRESGLSTQAFYRYFTSKDELLLVLLDEGGRRLLGYLGHRMEQQASVDLLAALLVPSITELNGHRRVDARRDADAVYHLAFGALRRHLTRGTRPTRAEVDHLTRFALGGIGHRGA